MAKQVLFTCALVVVMLVVVGQVVNCELMKGFERCDDTGAVIDKFELKNCLSYGKPVWPCILHPNHPIIYNLEFTSPVDFDKLKVVYQFEKKNKKIVLDACEGKWSYGAKCPGKQGEQVRMDISKTHLDEVLAMKGMWDDVMRLSLIDDETNKPLVCIKFPMKKGEGYY